MIMEEEVRIEHKDPNGNSFEVTVKHDRIIIKGTGDRQKWIQITFDQILDHWPKGLEVAKNVSPEERLNEFMSKFDDIDNDMS